MTLLLRILCGAIALAFVFAVANLFVSGHTVAASSNPDAQPAPIAAQVPDTQAAALSAPEAITPGPTTPQIMRDIAFALLGIETTPATRPVTSPTTTLPTTTLPTTTPPNAALPSAAPAATTAATATTAPAIVPSPSLTAAAAAPLTSTPLDAATPSDIRLVLTTPAPDTALSR